MSTKPKKTISDKETKYDNTVPKKAKKRDYYTRWRLKRGTLSVENDENDCDLQRLQYDEVRCRVGLTLTDEAEDRQK